jgi:hypothetical protein
VKPALPDLAEELLDAAPVVLCPAVFVGEIGSDVVIDAIAHSPVFDLRASAAELASAHLQGATRVLGAALGEDRQRATERVQAERGNRTRDGLHAGNGGRREQVPVPHISKRLIDANAILKHRETLRTARQRGSGKAAEDDVLLEGVALRRACGNAVRIATKEIGQIETPRPVEAASIERLDVCRNVLRRGAKSR